MNSISKCLAACVLAGTVSLVGITSSAAFVFSPSSAEPLRNLIEDNLIHKTQGQRTGRRPANRAGGARVGGGNRGGGRTAGGNARRNRNNALGAAAAIGVGAALLGAIANQSSANERGRRGDFRDRDRDRRDFRDRRRSRDRDDFRDRRRSSNRGDRRSCFMDTRRVRIWDQRRGELVWRTRRVRVCE